MTPLDPMAQLLAREELRDLVTDYAMAVDDHDLAAVREMFAPDAVFDRDGVLARGRDAVLEMLAGSMHGLRRMLHTPHSAVVTLAGGDRATGRSTGHAELVTSREVVIASYRYDDEFVRAEGRWVFASRRVRFVYATTTGEYVSTLTSGSTVRFPGSEPRSTAVLPRF